MEIDEVKGKVEEVMHYLVMYKDNDSDQWFQGLVYTDRDAAIKYLGSNIEVVKLISFSLPVKRF